MGNGFENLDFSHFLKAIDFRQKTAPKKTGKNARERSGVRDCKTGRKKKSPELPPGLFMSLLIDHFKFKIAKRVQQFLQPFDFRILLGKNHNGITDGCGTEKRYNSQENLIQD